MVEADLRRALSAWEDPDGVLPRIAAGAVTLVAAAEGAAVDLVDLDGNLVPACVEGLPDWPQGRRLPRDGSLSGLALSSGQAQCCDDSEIDPRVDRDACRAVGARSLVSVPLVRSGTPVGVFTVTSSRTRAFDEGVVGTLVELAGFLAVVIGTVARVQDRPFVEPVVPGRPTDLPTATSTSTTATAHGETTDPTVSTPTGLDADRVSAFVNEVIHPGSAATAAARQYIQDVIARRAITMVFQPVIKLSRRTAVGVEALARFPGPPEQTPDVWFAQARAVGLGTELELLAIEEALAVLRRLPPNMNLAVNASPTTVMSPGLLELLSAVDAHRVIVEITEHVAVDDYGLLSARIADLRQRGASISIDDTGSGYASFRHILSLSPEYIKLDLALTRNIDCDPARRALASALVGFVQESGARLVAEGIETPGELATVRHLGIEFGQGYHVGRPVPFDDLAVPGLRR